MAGGFVDVITDPSGDNLISLGLMLRGMGLGEGPGRGLAHAADVARGRKAEMEVAHSKGFIDAIMSGMSPQDAMRRNPGVNVSIAGQMLGRQLAEQDRIRERDERRAEEEWKLNRAASDRAAAAESQGLAWDAMVRAGAQPTTVPQIAAGSAPDADYVVPDIEVAGFTPGLKPTEMSPDRLGVPPEGFLAMMPKYLEMLQGEQSRVDTAAQRSRQERTDQDNAAMHRAQIQNYLQDNVRAEATAAGAETERKRGREQSLIDERAYSAIKSGKMTYAEARSSYPTAQWHLVDNWIKGNTQKPEKTPKEPAFKIGAMPNYEAPLVQIFGGGKDTQFLTPGMVSKGTPEQFAAANARLRREFENVRAELALAVQAQDENAIRTAQLKMSKLNGIAEEYKSFDPKLATAKTPDSKSPAPAKPTKGFLERTFPGMFGDTATGGW